MTKTTTMTTIQVNFNLWQSMSTRSQAYKHALTHSLLAHYLPSIRLQINRKNIHYQITIHTKLIITTTKILLNFNVSFFFSLHFVSIVVSVAHSFWPKILILPEKKVQHKWIIYRNTRKRNEWMNKWEEKEKKSNSFGISHTVGSIMSKCNQFGVFVVYGLALAATYIQIVIITCY